MFSVSTARTCSRLVVVMGLALFSSVALAEQWSLSSGATWPGAGTFSKWASLDAAGAHFRSQIEGGGATYTFVSATVLNASTTCSTHFPGRNCELWRYTYKSNTSTLTTDFLFPLDPMCPDGGVVVDDASGAPYCVTPTDCDGSITGESLWRPAFSAGLGGAICHESSQCKAVAADRTQLSDTAALIRYVGTNEGCIDEPAPPVSTATQCITQGGNTWCTEPNLADQNCGYFNDEFLCLAQVPDGNCTFYGNGDMACASNATAPPAPDDGVTPGDKATPDAGISASNGTTTNDVDIFNNTTVNNSLGAATGGHQGSGTGGPGQETPTIELDFSEIIEEGTDPTGPEDIDQNAADLDALYDEIETELGDPEDFSAPGIGLDDSIANVLTGSSCADIELPSQQYMPAVVFPCSALADLRAVLGWVLRIVLALQFFNMITTRPGS